MLGLNEIMRAHISPLKSIFCKQILKNLIRRLIWFCTVCLCSIKRTLGLNGLRLLFVLCWGNVVVYSLFIVVPLVGVLYLYLVLVLLCSTLCLLF